MEGRRLAVTAAALSLALGAAPAAGQSGYDFLGDLRSHERTGAGLVATCDPGTSLIVRFLTPVMVRVTLDRPDRDEALLEGPIARTEWPGAEVRFEETADRLALRSERLTVVVEKRPCRVGFLDAQGATLLRDDPGMGIGWDGNEVRNWKMIADERFFGLGEKTGDVDKRGREWVMWNSDTYGYGPETDPVYESIPFVIGVRGGRAYGVYLNNSYRSTFNLGAGNHRYWSFAADAGPLDYVFIGGPTVGGVVAAYTELTGRTPLPPRW
ncbi:MAG: alpha-glucosidase, partial [Gemmatimonadota bacterium]